MASTKVFTYTLTAGNSFVVTATQGFVKLSVFVQSSAGGNTTATVQGTLNPGGYNSNAVTLKEGEGVAWEIENLSPSLDGITVTSVDATVLITGLTQ